eukprot:46285-Eustigmatos_ZCMA.PRE.1
MTTGDEEDDALPSERRGEDDAAAEEGGLEGGEEDADGVGLSEVLRGVDVVLSVVVCFVVVGVVPLQCFGVE